ncbi:MAG: hypothetical protein ACRDFX_05545, partial [Chloroflexota bacterium]
MKVVTRGTATSRPHLVRFQPGRRFFAFNAALLVLALAALFSIRAASTAMRVGDVAGETIVAQHQVTYPDQLATDAKKRQAMASTPIVYEFSNQEAVLHRREAVAFLTGVGRILRNPSAVTGKQAALRKLLPAGIPASTLQQLFAVPAQGFPTVRLQSIRLLTQAEAWKFSTDQVQATALELLGTIPPAVSLPMRTAIGEVLSAFLTPTSVADIPATLAKRNAIAAKVSPVYATLYPGQVIIRRGDLVTSGIEQKLTALGLESHQRGLNDVGASFLFALVIVVMLFWYLHAFQPSVLANPRLLLFIDAALLLSVGAARLVSDGHVLLPFLLPLAAASTFAAVLIAPEACMALGLAIALLAGWAVANSFELS